MVFRLVPFALAPRLLPVVLDVGFFLVVLLLPVLRRLPGRALLFVLVPFRDAPALRVLFPFADRRPPLVAAAVLLLDVFRLDGVVDRLLERLRIWPTVAPMTAAPATASMGFSLTAAAAFFAPVVADDTALPAAEPPRETTLVPPLAARCAPPPTFWPAFLAPLPTVFALLPTVPLIVLTGAVTWFTSGILSSSFLSTPAEQPSRKQPKREGSS